MYARKVEAPRPYRAATVFAALAMLPDADVIGPHLLGLPDVGWAGHRGATHGLLFVALCTLVALWLAHRRGLRAGALLAPVLATLVAVGSHGVLDAMTQDGRGIMFLWPLSGARVHFPLRPFTDAPCGLAFLSRRGLLAAGRDLVLAGPFVLAVLAHGLLAARSTKRRRQLILSRHVAPLRIDQPPIPQYAQDSRRPR